MAFAPPSGSGNRRKAARDRGFMNSIWPHSNPSGHPPFAGKNCQRGPRSSPFGGSHALVCLFVPNARSTATTGHDLRPPSRGFPGVHDGDHGPFRRSLETAVLQGKSRRGPGSIPFGGSHGLVCLFCYIARSTATTAGRSGLVPPQRFNGREVGVRFRQSGPPVDRPVCRTCMVAPDGRSYAHSSAPISRAPTDHRQRLRVVLASRHPRGRG
jgi:hypothetical protein